MLPVITETISVLTNNMKRERKKMVWEVARNVDFCENNKNLSILKISNFRNKRLKFSTTLLILKL